MNIKSASDKYAAKITLLQDFVRANLGLNLDKFLISTYGGQKINRQDKARFFGRLIEDKLTTADINFIKNSMRGLKHLQDARSAVEYATDLVLGWCYEDAALTLLGEIGFIVNLSSADKVREFLKRPKSTPDIHVHLPDRKKIFRIELVKDNTGWWKRTGAIQLRDNKYMNLKKEKAWLLGLDTAGHEFFLIPVKSRRAVFVPFHFPFHKPAYELGLRESDFHPMKGLAKTLKEKLK